MSTHEIPSSTKRLEQYLIDPSLTIRKIRNGDRFMKIILLSDRTRWVLHHKDGRERFCSFLFLQEALEGIGSSKTKAADNKLFFYKTKVVCLSRYFTEKKIAESEWQEAYGDLQTVGYTNTTCLRNMRKVGDKTYVFDTKIESFDSKVHDKIYAMRITHAKIEALLLSKVATDEKKD